MPTRVKLPDGSIGEFPDGMSQQDIEGVLQKQYGGPQSSRPSPPIDYSHPEGLGGHAAPALPAHAPANLPGDRNARTLASAFPDGNPGSYASTQQFIQGSSPTFAGLGKAAQVSLGQAESDLSPSAVLHPLQRIAGELHQHATAPDISQATGPTEPTAGDFARFGASAAGNLAGLYQGGERPLADVPGNILRAPFTTAVDEPMAGGSTPRQRYNAAKALGVNLDLADATGSAVPKRLKEINENSLFGSSTNDAAKNGRIAAINSAANSLLGEMSPLDGEVGGNRLQGLLKQNQQGLLDASRSGYDTLSQQFGGMPVSDPTMISGIADNIKADQSQHLGEFPSLGLGKVGSVIEDASKYGRRISKYNAPEAPTIGNAIKARSGMLDMYQNNPELVKSAADAHLQQLVGGTDNAISDSLPSEGLDTWRDANSKFKEMKETYDNPSSPYYSAVRTPSPSTLVRGIGQTPELLRDLIARTGEEGRGIVQRGTAEKLMQTPSGDANLSRLPTNLSNLPEEYGQELFKGNLPRLRNLSSTAQALSKDLNPSGTAKQGQKLAEAASFIPTGGLPALQYPIAKFLNSPRIVDWMMKDPAPSSTTSAGVGKIAPAVIPALQPLVQKKTGTR